MNQWDQNCLTLSHLERKRWEVIYICVCAGINSTIVHIIQIWTCDEGNMEFYGSEATTLTKVKPRSSWLPEIHKTHIAWDHRSRFALLYVKMLWFKYIGLWIHILLDSLTNIPCSTVWGMALLSWSHIVMSDTIVVPEWHFCQTIVQNDVTIVAPWCWIICYNIVWTIWYFESICTITEGHVTRNWPISLEYLHLTYNKL